MVDLRIGILGTGLMGSAMARRLLRQRVSVVAWDRTPDHAQPLAALGAEIAGTAGNAVRRSDVVITMLPTADIVLDVVVHCGRLTGADAEIEARARELAEGPNVVHHYCPADAEPE